MGIRLRRICCGYRRCRGYWSCVHSNGLRRALRRDKDGCHSAPSTRSPRPAPADHTAAAHGQPCRPGSHSAREASAGSVAGRVVVWTRPFRCLDLTFFVPGERAAPAASTDAPPQRRQSSTSARSAWSRAASRFWDSLRRTCCPRHSGTSPRRKAWSARASRAAAENSGQPHRVKS